MKTKHIFLVLWSAGLISLSACSHKEDIAGTWQAIHPTDITSEVSSSACATALMSLTFGENTGGNGGRVSLTSLINAEQSVVSSPGIESGYEVSVAATATAEGRWMYAPGEDDEILINFEPGSLKVDVDPSGVTFRENMVTGAQEPVTDSLTNATAALWQSQIIVAMKHELTRYGRLDDVKIKTDNGKKILKFEIANPEQDVYMVGR